MLWYNHVLKGRPFGGTAIMWNKNVNAVIKAVSVDSNRIVAVTVVIENVKAAFDSACICQLKMAQLVM